ncbi:MAG: hypothetical protein MMC23_002552 [Stictis urceolatum]|nr:hypothetical protein [Stictis urceolata]
MESAGAEPIGFAISTGSFKRSEAVETSGLSECDIDARCDPARATKAGQQQHVAGLFLIFCSRVAAE